MIKHIVMWNILPDEKGPTKTANCDKVKKALLGLVGLVPEIRALTVDANVLHDSGNCDLILQAEFEDLAALERYQKNPEHLKVAALISTLRSSRAAVDYEF